MTAITDQQRQNSEMCSTLLTIEERASNLAATTSTQDNQELAELIEGLAQATRQLYLNQTQGWAPVLEDKR